MKLVHKRQILIWKDENGQVFVSLERWKGNRPDSVETYLSEWDMDITRTVLRPIMAQGWDRTKSFVESSMTLSPVPQEEEFEVLWKEESSLDFSLVNGTVRYFRLSSAVELNATLKISMNGLSHEMEIEGDDVEDLEVALETGNKEKMIQFLRRRINSLVTLFQKADPV